MTAQTVGGGLLGHIAELSKRWRSTQMVLPRNRPTSPEDIGGVCFLLECSCIGMSPELLLSPTSSYKFNLHNRAGSYCAYKNGATWWHLLLEWRRRWTWRSCATLAVVWQCWSLYAYLTSLCPRERIMPVSFQFKGRRLRGQRASHFLMLTSQPTIPGSRPSLTSWGKPNKDCTSSGSWNTPPSSHARYYDLLLLCVILQLHTGEVSGSPEGGRGQLSTLQDHHRPQSQTFTLTDWKRQPVISFSVFSSALWEKMEDNKNEN